MLYMVFDKKSLSVLKHCIWENIWTLTPKRRCLLCKTKDLTDIESLKIWTPFFRAQRHHLNSYCGRDFLWNGNLNLGALLWQDSQAFKVPGTLKSLGCQVKKTQEVVKKLLFHAVTDHNPLWVFCAWRNRWRWCRVPLYATQPNYHFISTNLQYRLHIPFSSAN